MLIKYIRTPKKLKARPFYKMDGPRANLYEVGGDPIGVIVAIGKDQIGWSLCNPLDSYDRKLGLAIAENRAIDYGINKEKVIKECPMSIRQDIIEMYERAEKYFK